MRLKDVLEDVVEEKYYLSEEVYNRFKMQHEDNGAKNIIGTTAPDFRTIGQNSVMGSLVATDYKQPKQTIDYNVSLKCIGGIENKNNQTKYNAFPQGNRVYDSNGVACSQLAQSGGIGSVTGLYKVDEYRNGAIGGRYNEHGKVEQQLGLRDDGDTNTITTVEKDNVVVENNDPRIDMLGSLDMKGNEQIRRLYGEKGIAPTLNTMQGGNRQPKVREETEYKIRKLTPRECWRLMGFTDEEFNRAEEMNTSNSQLYKQAGNSIVVNCLYYIFKEVFKKYIIK